MTPNQWRMLEILEHWDGWGHMEVEIHWGGYNFGDTEAAEAKGFRVNRLVVAGLVRSLVKKGFARDDADGYGITETGRAILVKRSTRLRK